MGRGRGLKGWGVGGVEEEWEGVGGVGRGRGLEGWGVGGG